MDRDACPLHHALKRAEIDSKLVPLSVKLTPKKFGESLYRKMRERDVIHVDFMADSSGGSKFWVKNNKADINEITKEIMEENNYFEGNAKAKAILDQANKILDKDKKVVVLDMGYVGGIPAFLSHLLEKEGFDADWDLVLHHSTPSQLRPSFHTLKVLEDKTDSALNRTKKITAIPSERKNSKKAVKEYHIILEAMSQEITRQVKKKSAKKQVLSRLLNLFRS